ncbi:hypothetical protein SAMN04489832_5169 [Micromonospora cremea]|uniref:Uncharacterized protein n=1 Tax=Micromonospora cremea TaxID=709881 RepID=A0A1N6A9X4_9ACTN|nr:hypothetical protein SAMN04489832_5169 [Micromonospora cremea]
MAVPTHDRRPASLRPWAPGLSLSHRLPTLVVWLSFGLGIEGCQGCSADR